MSLNDYSDSRFGCTKDGLHVVQWNTILERFVSDLQSQYMPDQVVIFPETCATPEAALDRTRQLRHELDYGISQEALALLCDPELWKKIDTELGVTIKEDADGRHATFAIMLTAFLPKPANLMLLGSSAIGKTWLALNVSTFLPQENVIILGSSTQRAWFYCGEPVYKPHPVIAKKEIVDYWKINWTAKVVIILDNVLPSTIKDLKPIQSHDRNEIDIQTTEQTRAGRHQTRRVKNIGWPSFINCTTHLQWEGELTSRHFYLTPKDAPEKYKAAGDYLDPEYLTGIEAKSEKTQIIQEALRALIKRNYKVVVQPEVLTKLKERFTWKTGKDVRDYQRAVTLVQAVAWLHALQRGRDSNQNIIADTQDLEIVNGFIEPLLKTSRYGTSSEVIDYYEQVLKPTAEIKDANYAEIRAAYLQHYSRPLSRDDLQTMNRACESLGLIELNKDPLDGRRRLIHLPTIQAKIMM